MDTLNQIDISIIIPIYNVEKYLTVCIDSLKNQGGLRMEIILVNDGSTDLSGEIADEYAKKEERIKVIHQENGGASAARNVGLDIATEEYIAFLAYIIHSGFISGYQNRYGDNLKPPTNVYHRMTA